MSQRYKVQSRQVRFPGFDGNLLAGTLDYPQESEPSKYVLISHCFTCTRQTLTTARLSRGLAQAGLAVLRFDFTGLGDSEGDFAATHFNSMVSDIVCAAEFLAKYYQPPAFLIGHSMGGTASLAASQLEIKGLSQLIGVATLASPAAPAHVLHHFGAAMPLLEKGENAEIIVAGRAYPVKPEFVNDVRSYDMSSQMRGCVHRILAAKAGEDGIVDAGAAEQILEYTQGDRCLVEIDGADHLFSDRKHAEQLEHAVVDWVNRQRD